MREKSRFQDYAKFLVYMVVVILVNIAGITLFHRTDLTQNKIYSISNISKKVASTLSEPLTIKVFFSKNLPAPHNQTERYLHDLLAEYAIHANKYFNYQFYDISLEQGAEEGKTSENQQMANNYGIYPIQLQNIEKDEVKFQKAYMGLVIIHGDLIEKIPAITSTNRLEYRLTTSIMKLNNKISALLNLKEKIHIKLILSSSLKTIAPFLQLDELVTLPETLGNIVQKMEAGNYGKLDFELLDPSKDETLASVVEKYDVLNLSWPAIPEHHIQKDSGSVGLVMEFKDKVISVPIVSAVRIPIIGVQYSMVDMENMERILNENIESLIDINEDIGYLADHGTPQAPMEATMSPFQQPDQDPISNFRRMVSQGYTIRDLVIRDRPIPDGFNCLIIAGPKEPFTEYELFQIDQFLMRGRNLALFLDAFNEITASPNQPYAAGQGPQFLPIKTGLEKLLEHYGVHIDPSYVLDKNCFKQFARTRSGGREIPVYVAPVIKNDFINQAPDFMKNIKELIVLKASPIELDEDRIKANGVTSTKLLSSSKESWKMSGRINLNPLFIHPPSEDEMESLPLAYMLEGEFPSYFEGKPIPEKDKPKSEEADQDTKAQKAEIDLSKIEGKGEIITKGKPGKIFLIGSSQLLMNNMLDPEGTSTNATFVMNILDSLNNRNEIALMRSKEQLFNPLAETGPEIKTFVKAFSIAGLPFLVVAFGLMVWFRRHSRQKKIQSMFQ